MDNTNDNFDWIMIDANGHRPGRVASVAAEYLLGKNRTDTKPNLVPKNKVIIINASKIDVTHKRKEDKVYTRYSGYPGGLTKETMDELLERKPERLMEKAIKGMLPKNKRGNKIFADNLYVYADDQHPHEAHKPQLINIGEITNL